MCKKKKIWIIVLSSAAAFIGVVLFCLLWFRSFHFHLNGKSVQTLEVGETYIEEGCTAHYGWTKLKNVEISGTVDANVLGDYEVTYTAHYGKKQGSAVRKVLVRDTLPPSITAPESVTVTKGLSPEAAQLEYTVLDAYEGDLTDQVTIDYSKKKITLTVSDTAGNKAEKEIAIEWVDDTDPPVVTLSGGRHVFLRLGGSFDDPGYSASDNVDGDMTTRVTVRGLAALEAVGTHTLTYTVADAAGNTGSATRNVTVYDPDAPYDPSNADSRVIYLTFDDGPCVYTPQILDVLARYGVKATFFVTNQKPDYQHLIAREAKEGHTVALHTYSHQYSVYSSTDQYFADLEAMNEVIKQQTGQYTRLMRFPGGSSNTISRKYSSGIMSRLTKEVTDRGYLYFDWNVSSGDASGTAAARDPGFISRNVINALGDGSYVVLMHDINSTNIQSLPIIIEYGLSNGYRFAPLDEHSPGKHHGVNN